MLGIPSMNKNIINQTITSKVLTNEYKENINDGTIMTYGSLNEK